MLASQVHVIAIIELFVDGLSIFNTSAPGLIVCWLRNWMFSRKALYSKFKNLWKNFIFLFNFLSTTEQSWNIAEINIIKIYDVYPMILFRYQKGLHAKIQKMLFKTWYIWMKCYRFSIIQYRHDRFKKLFKSDYEGEHENPLHNSSSKSKYITA